MAPFSRFPICLCSFDSSFPLHCLTSFLVTILFLTLFSTTLASAGLFSFHTSFLPWRECLGVSFYLPTRGVWLFLDILGRKEETLKLSNFSFGRTSLNSLPLKTFTNLHPLLGRVWTVAWGLKVSILMSPTFSSADNHLFIFVFKPIP